MLSYDEALEAIVRTVRPLTPVEASLEEAFGRVLAEPVASRWDLPPADNSAMDGYAFAWQGQKAGGRLAVTGFVPAGAAPSGMIPAGTATKIMTGAPLPPGCDTVVPLEEVVEEEGCIRLAADSAAGRHIRRRGEELRKGETLLSAGSVIRAGETGLLAAGGIDRLTVYPKPRVALLATGDELVELGTPPGPGQIVNSNIHLLAARLREEGHPVIPLGIAADDPDALAAKIQQGLEADLLITTGGVSVGDRDYVQEVLARFGFSRTFWKVAIKPGKPLLFGMIGALPVFGLPGNPAASAATFDLFVRPALRLLAGRRQILHPRLRVVLADAVKGGGRRQNFLWGTLQRQSDGTYRFTPSSRQGSGQNRSLVEAHGLLPVPIGAAELPAGAEVEVLVLGLPDEPAS